MVCRSKVVSLGRCSQVDGAVHGSEVGPPSRELGQWMCGNEGGGGQVLGKALSNCTVAEKEKGEAEVGENQ
jgi:hypothetical protein